MSNGTKSSEVVFFLGAGASKEAGVPLTYEFVKLFKEDLAKKSKLKLEIVKEIEEKLTNWKKSGIDIELLMEALDRLSKEDEEIILALIETDAYLLKGIQESKEILIALKDFVKKKSKVTENKIRYLDPLLDFIEDFHPLDIFSVNYDICIEQFCSFYQKSYRDGFEVEWNPKVFEHPNLDLRLYKLHGSIRWYKTERGNFINLPVETDKGTIKLDTGEIAETLMLYPMRKWEYAEPLLENLIELKNKLQSETCKYVFVIGYSFRDEHIRNIFWDAARKNKQLIIFLVDPKSYEIYRDKLKYYDVNKQNRSSLSGKVICLAYHFEDVFRVLRSQYLKKLQNAIGNIRNNRERELSGEKPYWLGIVEFLSECEYSEKLEEILADKLNVRSGRQRTMELEGRTPEIMALTPKIDVKSLVKLFCYQSASYLRQERSDEAENSLLDLCAAINLIFVQKLNITIYESNISIKFYNEEKENPPYLTSNELSQLFDKCLKELTHPKNSKIVNRIDLLRKLVNQICVYLDEWKDNKMSLTNYLVSRGSDYKTLCSEIERERNKSGPLEGRTLMTVPEANIGRIALEIERKVIGKLLKNVLSNYLPHHMIGD